VLVGVGAANARHVISLATDSECVVQALGGRTRSSCCTFCLVRIGDDELQKVQPFCSRTSGPNR
jgi:hypothetical protein